MFLSNSIPSLLLLPSAQKSLCISLALSPVSGPCLRFQVTVLRQCAILVQSTQCALRYEFFVAIYPVGQYLSRQCVCLLGLVGSSPRLRLCRCEGLCGGGRQAKHGFLPPIFFLFAVTP